MQGVYEFGFSTATVAERHNPYGLTAIGQFYVSNVKTAPGHERLGWAYLLLELICSDADREGVSLWLVCAPENPAHEHWVRRLYEKFDFVWDIGGVMYRKAKIDCG